MSESGAGNHHVEVISKDIIKPSRETPSNLKTLKLSLLDQLVPSVYTPIIFFYEADAVRNPTEMCQKLKESLSRALATYYPVAGKTDLLNSCIQCNDYGAEFVEARVHARLSDVLNLKEPNLEWVKNHLPVVVDGPGGINVGDGPNFRAQVNFFDCGGISVGVCTSHTVADGASMVQFLNEWAKECREEDHKHAPSTNSVNLDDFNAGARFLPAQDLSLLSTLPAIVRRNAKSVTKSYVFTKEKLNSLKRIATTCRRSDLVDNPTRVELATAFIWKVFISNNWDASRSFHAIQAVNLRRRACESFQLENAFGNCVVAALASISPLNEAIPPLEELVIQLRKNVRGINDEYMRKIRDENRYLTDFQQMFATMPPGGGSICALSSWCGFPVYEVDFGWGKPAWVSVVTGFVIDNMSVLVDTSCGEGIEAFVSLNDPQEIEAFDAQFNQI